MKLIGAVIVLFCLAVVGAGCGGGGGGGQQPDLSGKWSGWGTVTLSGLAGSYTDSYGRAPTKIELKWTGDRTLEGRWSEGTYRFGWLKLTLSADGNTLSGTWGADANCERNPGSPKQDKLSWRRAP